MRSKSLKRQFLDKMTEDKLFLNPDLEVIRKKMSSSLGISVVNIETFVKTHFSCSFRELVNEYRVNKAASELADPGLEEKKIIEIAFDSGFGSLRAFNANFKSSTGYNPTEYRAFQKNFRKYLGVSPAEFRNGNERLD